jgi:hypothetical protein
MRSAQGSPKPLLRHWIPPAALLLFGCAWTIGLFVVASTSYLGVLVPYLRGHYIEVHGRIQNFQAGDPDGHREETWSVAADDGTHTYTYNPYRLVGGYSRVSMANGPLRNGAEVRVADVRGQIARLEVRTP